MSITSSFPPQINISGTGIVDPGVFHARLTTESGVPVSITDRTAQATIYLTPYLGTYITLYDGSNWIYFSLNEINLALSGLTSGKNYDVWCYSNAGAPTLELSSAWTNDTTRADALALQNGVYVKSGTPTRRYVGTIRTTGTTTTEDSASKRFVWNNYNRVERYCQGPTETTDTWNYSTATIRQANANTANRFEFVQGLLENIIKANVISSGGTSGSTVNGEVGIGVDSTTVFATGFINNIGTSGTGFNRNQSAYWQGYMTAVGYHAINWLETGNGTATMTWYGDVGAPTVIQSGIFGSIWN